MGINYGSLGEPKPRKKREKNLINHGSLDASADGLTDEQLKQFSRKRLIELAKQQRAPSVAKAAAAELWERVEPRKEQREAQMSAADAVRIADIYEAHEAVFAVSVMPFGAGKLRRTWLCLGG